MKYLLIISLAISTLLVAQDEPQIPGWGVYVGGALNSVTMDPEQEGVTLGSQLNLPFVGVSRGIQLGGFPLLVGAGLGKRGYSMEMEAFGIKMESKASLDLLDFWATVPYPVGPVIAQVGFVYGIGLGSGKVEIDIDGTTIEEDIEGEFGDETDFGLIFGAAYPINQNIGINFGYALGLKDQGEGEGEGEDGFGMKYNGLYLLLGYNF